MTKTLIALAALGIAALPAAANEELAKKSAVFERLYGSTAGALSPQPRRIR